MPVATVHLVRHGEVHNPDRVLYGRIPGYGLSELGRRMAEDVADWFAAEAEATGRRPVLLVASSLQRAQETAAPIGRALELDVGTDDRVLEATNRFEGLAQVSRRLRDPRLWPLLVNPFRPSWGEPYRAQVARMAEAVQDLRDRAIALDGEGAEAIVVSHQLPIWVTRLSVEGRPLWHDPRRRECTLTSVTSLHFEAGRAVPRVEYREPNAALLGQASSLPGA
ncbi:histidine phosphatase family protein [Citricoccus sp. SGAir0253]|uniref:histidine phosphatase family protein n=1 Tax=Citricoccus sp. SGAir0253 TaxID=2567881 RepID=UPI0010CD3498|nr:histidine phosphatase family protein [Citricoccus sp. SGAir0253]QCU77363.1 histidine phosphatase family protein [Citricoccus sp. SGAir0253]